MARNPAASINTVLQSLSDAEARDLIVALFRGTPSFDPSQHTAASINGFIHAWLSAGSIATNAVMLAASGIIARRTPPAPAVPAAPPAPAAYNLAADARATEMLAAQGLSPTGRALQPAPLVIPTLIPAAQPAPADPTLSLVWDTAQKCFVKFDPLKCVSAPVLAPFAEMPQQPVQSLHAAVAQAVEDVSDDPPAIVPLIAQNSPTNTPTRVSARSLFADQPKSVIDAIPQVLSVTIYNSPDAPVINPIYAFDGANLAAALSALACTPAQNVWLGGPRGAGKTAFVQQLAARLSRPFFRVNFNRSTESADFLGDIGLHNGSTAWQDGPATTARRTPGAILLLDEITYAAQGHLAALNPILERNGEALRLPRTGERLSPAPDTAIFAADNTFGHGDTSGEYIARSAMGGDTLDRFAKFLRFDYLPEATERKVLRAMVHTECGTRPDATMAKNVCTLMRVCRTKAENGELSGAPSLRRAAAFCVALVQGFDATTAYADTIVRAAPEDSQEALRQIYAATWPHDGAAVNAAPDGNPFAHTPGAN